MTDNELQKLHDLSTLNRYAIDASDQIGCFHCERMWDPLEFPIKEWCDGNFCEENKDTPGEGNATALCPFCGIDSILTKLGAGEITTEMLDAMNRRWFTK